MKSQHAQLEQLLASLSERIAENDGAGARQLLPELHRTFGNHVALEEQRLYPTLLEKTAEGGLTTQALLARSYANGLGVLTSALERFVGRHQSEVNPDLDVFAQEWSTMVHALRSRFQAEEQSLYPMFARLLR